MVADEKSGGGGMHLRVLLDGFNDVINECQLMDLGYTGSKFT